MDCTTFLLWTLISGLGTATMTFGHVWGGWVGSVCWGTRGRKVGLLQRERCSGHMKPGPALPVLVGLCHHTSNAREVSWWGGRKSNHCKHKSKHTHSCCHPISQQVTPAPSHDSLVSLDHPVLQQRDTLCAKNPSASLLFSTFPLSELYVSGWNQKMEYLFEILKS